MWSSLEEEVRHPCTLQNDFIFSHRFQTTDSACEEASYLTKFVSKVYVVHRKDTFRASKIMQKRVFDNPKIEVLWNTVVEEIHGDTSNGKLKGVAIKNLKSGESKLLEVKGLFLAIGHIPNSSVFKGVETDDQGYIVTKGKSTATNIHGVFACGDVMDVSYKQAITAAGTGCMAAIECERWLAEHSG